MPNAVIAPFELDQLVKFTSGGYVDVRVDGVFKVTRILPRDDTGLQYYIRCERDGHTRRVHHSQLVGMPDLLKRSVL